ncbi:putative coiled-coil protein SlyX [Hydrogenophaga palleronii]|uniref:Coiled-coil protein SlyX n=1 Tax=Hydrogenophaga palleronii TaxID=65655 RepID=A0ABU1WRS4_9BURK|nr:hypothetical protein [Hydrogenophaga palleronii]MDR7152013.1 putative coiled-coil protein SlyX [Hydrogenophaga palleronii]
MSTDTVAIISAIAALLSAIGGGVACIAAFRSATHAKATFDSAQLAEKRLVLRQLSVTAHEIVIEVDRIKWVALGLKVSYQTLFTFAGQLGSSRQQLYQQEIEVKLQEAERLLKIAAPFATFQDKLLNGPLEEITSREILVSQTAMQVRALLAKLEEEQRTIETQNQTHRERTLRR